MLSEIIYRMIQKFGFIKKTRIFEFCRSILFPLLIRNISILFKDDIDEKLIVMGAYSGAGFVDNTKYLFKFLPERSNNKVVWVAKFFDLYLDMKNKGYEVVSHYSIETIRLLRKAKFIFLTHGYGDVLPIKFSPKSTIILLQHGTPFKRGDKGLHKTFEYGIWNRIFRLNLQHNQYVDYIITPTRDQIEHKITSYNFRASLKKVIPLGFPRNDILFNKDKDFILKLREKYKIPNNIKEIILYAPTWREGLIMGFPFSESELNALNSILEERNALFLLKIHMVSQKVYFKNYKNIRIVKKTADTQELLLISNILITDYSSIFYDYLLTMNPILFFTYDFDTYKRGFFYDYKEIVPGPMLYNVNELIGAIRNIDKIEQDYRDKRIEIRDRFNKYNDDKSSERISNFFKIEFD